MKFLHACLLSKLPTMEPPDVIQIWRVELTPLPERRGRFRLESESEFNGELESQEAVTERDEMHRLRTGRPQDTINDLGVGLTDATGHLLTPLPPSYTESIRRALGRELGTMDRRVREASEDPMLMRVRENLNELTQFTQARGIWDSHVSENVRQADLHIMQLEEQISELRAVRQVVPVRQRLHSLELELERAETTRGGLVPTTSLTQTDQLSAQIQNTAANLVSELWRRLTVEIPRVLDTLGSLDRIHRITAENLRRLLRELHNHVHDVDTEAFTATSDAINGLFQDLAGARDNLARARPTTQSLLHNVQEAIALTANIITSATHGEANRAIIEGSATDGDADSSSTSEEEEGEPTDAVSGDPAVDRNASSDSTFEDVGRGEGAITENPATDGDTN